MVYVADLLRFCGRDGDIFDVKRRGSIIDGARHEDFSGVDDGVEFFLPVDTVRPNRLLLHGMALFIAGIVNGVIHDQLA